MNVQSYWLVIDLFLDMFASADANGMPLHKPGW